ncbi:MAG: type II toxin-antitoxin system Phd/YefM family antitoxin [Planctomycetota bacterium]|nr:MAG: type II toxin-antitoxin system Phd/YefM family antitoxin [Planctomycetota bacterium]
MPIKSYSLSEAKTKLSDLAAEVERGSMTIVITRSGKPVAKLVPYTDGGLAERRAKVLAELRQAAQEAGIQYSREELIAPIPEEYWGVFAEGPDDASGSDDGTIKIQATD